MKKKVLGLISILVIVVLMFTVVKKEVINSNATKAEATAEETVEITSQGLVITANGLVADNINATTLENNTKHLQQCIDNVSEAGGGTVRIPAGTYYFAPQETVIRYEKEFSHYVIKCKNNVLVEGEGNDESTGTVLKPYGKTTYGLDMFYYDEYADSEYTDKTYLENADFKNFVIDAENANGQNYNTSGMGFAINLYMDCDWDSVTVKNTDATGFGMDCPINSTIKNCSAISCGKNAPTDGIGGSGFGLGTGYSDSEYIYVNNCEAINNKRYGFFFEHQGIWSDGAYYTATKSDGFIVTDSSASGNMYDFGGRKSYDVLYENCKSYYGEEENTTTIESYNFSEESSRRSYIRKGTYSRDYTDVSEGSLYYDAVKWGRETGVAFGYTDTEFGYAENTNRSQVIQWLFRHAGRPGNVSFDDIVTGFDDLDNDLDDGVDDFEDKISDSVKWAEDEGIIDTPTGTTNFGPYENVTRGEYIIMLWKYAGSPEVDYNPDFSDWGDNEELEKACRWATSFRIVDGVTLLEFKPDDNCTRGWALSWLYNYAINWNDEYDKNEDIEYKIVYNLQGGTVKLANPTTYTYTSAEKNITLNNPTKEGYTFKGWIGKSYTTDANGETCCEPLTTLTIDTTDRDNKVYSAIWEANTYTITFDANGGTGEMEQQYYTYDNPQALLENKFTNEGYIFDGWNTAKDGSGTSYTNGAVIENLGNLTLYAQWKYAKISYYISSYLENLDGTYPDEPYKTSNAIEGTLGETALKPPSTYPGYSFLDEGDVTLVEDGQVVKYKFTRNTYNINLILGTGIEVDNKTQILPTKYGTPVTLQVHESFKDGYDSENLVWSGDYDTNTFTMPAEDVTITVNATPIKYTIEYELDDGTVEGNPTTYTVEDTITLIDPTKEGYEFVGWIDAEGNNLGKGYTIKSGTIGNLILTANWVEADVAVEYTVEYHKQAIDTSYPDNLVEKRTLTGIVGEKVTGEIKEFEGFTTPTEEEEITLSANAEENVIEYKYPRKSFYAELVDKGGVIAQASRPFKFEETVPLQLEAKEGYQNPRIINKSIVEWIEDEENSFYMPAYDVVLEGKATPITYTIDYELDGGTLDGAPEDYTVESEDIVLGQPTKDGYVFTGWTDENGKDLGKEVIIPAGSTGDKTYIANWEEEVIKYKVDVTLGKGIELVSGATNYEAGTQVTLSATVKEGYDENSITWSGKYTSNTFTMPAEDVTMTVSATPITYKITYSEDGKVEGNPTTYTIESEDIVLEQPTKEGYEFAGWTDENGKDLGKEVTIPAGSTGDKTYIANWEVAKVTYKVEHYKQLLDGTYAQTPDNTQNGTGEVGEEITGTVKTYTGFTSPTPKTIELSANAEENVIVYKYVRNSYNITITKGIGIENVSGEGSHKYNEEVTLLATVKDGYRNPIWTGDYDSNTFPMPAEDVQMSVSAELIEYTIEYNLNGGNVEGNPTKYTIETDDITLINPTRTGYTFTGWTDSNGNNLGKEVTIEKGSTGNLIYTANWEVAQTESPKKLELEISYSTKELTNKDVTVIISANNKIEPVEGWTLSEDEKSISKVYEQNGSETVTIVDEYGNEKNQPVEVTNIDKIPPEVEITYEEKDGYVIATAKTNEKVREVDGWELSEDKQELTKIYYVNKEEEFTFIDLAGNETKKTVKITSIEELDDDDGNDNAGNNNDGNNDTGNTTTDKDSTGGSKTDTTVSNKDIPAAGLKYILGTGIVLAVLGVLSFAKMKKYKDIK